MKGKRPLAALIAIAMLTSVFAGSAVAAVSPAAQQDCDANVLQQGQSSDDLQLGNVNTDLNVNAGNVNLLNNGDGGDQVIYDSQDEFQSDDQYQDVSC